jgi:hypothetical protein
MAQAHEDQPKDQEKGGDAAYDEVIDLLQAQIEDRAEERKNPGSGKGSAKGVEELDDQGLPKKKSNWKFDPDAWRKMPLFMDEITEKDVEENEMCAGLSSMIYEGVPPEEIAEARKKVGNDCITRALDPNQVRASNWARQAIYAYTEGLDQGCKDRKLNAQLYSNRSLANFLLENYGKGLADAQRAILMDETFVKPYYRGAKCAEKIRKYEIAKSLISKGLEITTDATQIAEFNAVAAAVKAGEDGSAAAAKKEKLKQRVEAAGTNNLLKEITSKGIKVVARPEVQSEQWNQLSSKKPFFDAEGVLHVPILFMYDEYNTTDFLQDVPTDCSIADCLESELMPFPFDDRGRYRSVDDLVAVYIVDDGVAMPKYFAADLSWTIFEIFRSQDYVMPNLVPVFHIVPKDSDILVQWGLGKR